MGPFQGNSRLLPLGLQPRVELFSRDGNPQNLSAMSLPWGLPAPPVQVPPSLTFPSSKRGISCTT